MRRGFYIFILFTIALLCGCSVDEDVAIYDSGIVVERMDDGRISVDMPIEIVDMVSQDVITRASDSTDPSHPENTLTDGWGFVFAQSTDPNDEDGYGDSSVLLQKTELTINSNNRVIFLFDEVEEMCFFRLMVNLTDDANAEVEAMVSKRMLDNDSVDADTPLTTFEDYKHLSVDLNAFYYNADTPNPNYTGDSPSHGGNIREEFPMASPGIAMSDGLNIESLTNLNSTQTIQLVRVGSKLDVTNEDSDFELEGVTMFNGAKKALMRSTVLNDDGVTINSISLPVNYGGTTTFTEVAATSNTTENYPIYFFPNEGDTPTSDPDLGLEGEDTDNISDPINGKNPTFIILRGKWRGSSEDSYYKVAIEYSSSLASTDDSEALTYDIIRNNLFSVYIKSVNNAGYKSLDEAKVGTGSNVSYDIEVGGESDSRHDYSISNGSFYMELIGSKIYARGYTYAGGVDGDIEVKVYPNTDKGFTVTPTLHVWASDGITIATAATVDPAPSIDHTVTFTATQSGTIYVQCGDLLKEIPVVYQDEAFTMRGGELTVNDERPFTEATEIITNANNEYDISSYGIVEANETINQRGYKATVYTTDKGVIKVYCVQANNFFLYYNQTTTLIAEGATESVEFMSTGATYKYNDTAATNDIQYYVKGEFVTLSNTTPSSSFLTATIDGAWVTFAGSYIEPYVEQTLSLSDYPSVPSSTTSPTTHPESSLTLTAQNYAGDTKTYTINLKQYTPAYIVGDFRKIISGHGSNTKEEDLGYWYIYNAQTSANWSCLFITDNTSVFDYEQYYHARIVETFTSDTSTDGYYTRHTLDLERSDDSDARLYDWEGDYTITAVNLIGESFSKTFEVDLKYSQSNSYRTD